MSSVVVKLSDGAIKVRLQCSLYSLPDFGLPWSAPNISNTILLSNWTLNLCSYHSAYASSILMYVVMFHPGECVYASLASPPYSFLLYLAAREWRSVSEVGALRKRNMLWRVRVVSVLHIWIRYSIILLFLFCLFWHCIPSGVWGLWGFVACW